jgi:16S rRNA (guanine(966)-N(2))-methyltransferase RsmD
MRVIAGEFRSRQLKSLPGNATRPTPDRLREALFNILQDRIHGARFLDGYAGTGAVGIEALSRGALHAIFLESGTPALDAIAENLTALGLRGRSTVKAGPVLRTLPKCQADIVFLDPPYSLALEYRGALDALGVKPPALVIVQHSVRFELEERYGSLARTRHLKQGENALSFFEPDSTV